MFKLLINNPLRIYDNEGVIIKVNTLVGIVILGATFVCQFKKLRPYIYIVMNLLLPF